MRNIGLGVLLMTVLAISMLSACGNKEEGKSDDSQVVNEDDSGTAGETDDIKEDTEQEVVTILVAAAASLEYSYTDELIPLFQQQYPWIQVEGTYDSSGKLQTQIEEGLEADVFMSAAMKQMNELKDQEIVDADTIVQLLENKIVLIVPADVETGFASFEDIVKADIAALGDPESVPAGQYAEEALATLGLWEEVSAKASFGTNVTEVLNWVAEGSADAGIVYATDAATTDQVIVIGEAPEDSLAEKVIYPVAVVSGSAQKEAAQLFVDFLGSKEAIAILESYGFTSNID